MRSCGAGRTGGATCEVAESGPGRQARWRPNPALADAELDGERVLWDPVSGKTVRLDRVGSMVWACLDGATCLDEVSAELAEVFGMGPEAVRTDVAPLVTRLWDLGFLVEETPEPI